jgi:hypothetical protein
LPPSLRPWLFPTLFLALCYAAWRSYGWQGLLLATLMSSFWVLLHFTKLLRLLRAAAARPKGMVNDVPALQRQLRPGLPMHEVVRRTACLGERPADATTDEVFDWQDEQGRRLRLHFRAGRLARIERRDLEDPGSAGPTPLQP